MKYGKSAALALLGFVGQAVAQSSAFCDSTNGVCYQRYAETVHNLQLSIAMPPATDTITEMLVEIIAPATIGWVGITLGGRMENNLLLVAWPNGNQAMVSPRWIDDYIQPLPYDGPIITMLPGSGVNATNFKASFRCQNCVTWRDGSLSTTADSVLAYAVSDTVPVDNPTDLNTNFNEHNDYNFWEFLVLDAEETAYSSYLTKQLASATVSTTSVTRTTTSATGTSTYVPLCAGAPNPIYPLLTVPGWRAAVITNGLTSPRGIAFDKAGNLLVVQSGKGVSALKLNPTTGCLVSSSWVVNNTALNHGIAFSPDGNTLFVSSPDMLWKFNYNPSTVTATNGVVIVNSMNNADHITRTIVNPIKNPTLLVVSRGSNDNLDLDSFSSTAGRAMVKVFNLNSVPSGGYNFTTQGSVLGYGIRNEVGMVEDGAGDIWGVQNSSDDLKRVANGVSTDVHQGNPSEKLENLGNPASPSGAWYGYPYCFLVWDATLFVDKVFHAGDQFVQDQTTVVNGVTINDAYCEAHAKKPSVMFQPHSAPLDIKIGINGDTNAYVTFHGSWDRVPSTGYQVVAVPGQFNTNGGWSPTGTETSLTAYSGVFMNRDATQCSTGCFRPVGLSWSPLGDLYVSSDASGEIFILRKTGGVTTSSTQISSTTSTTSRTTSTTSRTTSTTSTIRTTSTSTRTTSTTSRTTSASGPYQTQYGQCGGISWTGPTQCAPPLVCVALSPPYYYQCLTSAPPGF